MMIAMRGYLAATDALARAGLERMGPSVSVRVGGGVAIDSGHGGALSENPDAGLRLVGDLRLDNRDELVRALGLDGSSDEPTDAFLARAAFERWRDEMGSRLLGDFALAIWDERARELHLVRDPFGVKRLYYALLRDGVAFASDLRSLLALPELDRKPNERAIVDYLGGFPADEERTAVEAVRRVPPGHGACFSPRAKRAYEYFRFDPERVSNLGDAAAAEAVASELSRAVLCRLPATGSVGVLLSGGLDSSSVACLAASHLAHGRELRTFSARFDGDRDCDERELQRRVVDQIGSNHVSVDAENARAGTDLTELINVLEEPSLIGGHWLIWPLIVEAARCDVGVMLTGVDGDRVVSHGQGRLEELARQGRWVSLAREISARASPFRLPRVLAAKFAVAKLPAVTQAFHATRRRTHLIRSAEFRLLRVDVVRRTHVTERVLRDAAPSRDARDAHLRALTRWDRASDVEVCSALGAAFGVEFRHPFFDRRLAELCLSLSSDQKVRHGQSRYVLREAMRRVIPEKNRVSRRKAHFDASFERWARRVVRLQRAGNPIGFQNLEPYLRVTALLDSSLDLPMDLVWRCVVVSAWLRHLVTC